MVLTSSLPDIVIPDVPLGKYLLDSMKRYGEAEAIVEYRTKKSYTFKEVREHSMRCTVVLRNLGIVKGDIVAVCCSNCTESIFINIAAACCGVTVTTCNQTYTKDEIVNQFKDSLPKVVFTEAKTFATLKSVSEEVKSIQKLVCIDDSTECDTLSKLMDSADLNDFSFDDTISKDDVWLLPYSSGTTGLPKGVMLSHGNAVFILTTAKIALHLSQLDVTYMVLPSFHIYGAVFSLSCLDQGSKMIIEKRFDLVALFQAIEKYKISYFCAVPPILVAMDKTPLSSQYDVSSLNRVMCAAAPLPETIAKSVAKKLGFNMVQGWGLTEAVPATTTIDLVYPMKSVGTVIPNTLLKVLDTVTGKELGVSEDGELCIKGPQVMLGYYKKPDATANCLDEEGWLHTGDIGHYDEHGYVYVVDRLKELIKYKGFQIAPAELEEVLLRHPKIADVGVIGIANPESGEVPKAFVVKKDQSLTEDEIHEFLKDKISKYKYIRGGFTFLSAIPKTASGKILRRNLREMQSKST